MPNQQVVDELRTMRERLYEIQVEVLEGGKLPTKAHASDAGFDLYSPEDFKILPGQVKRIPLNIRFKLPSSSYLSIESKSGLGAKGLLVFAGVIDAGYSGVVSAVISNIKTVNDDGSVNTTPIVFHKGDKLCQCVPFPFSTIYYIKIVDQIEQITDRGEKGFGSSGK